MSALRHQGYVVYKLCALMYQGPFIVLVQRNSTLQLEFCG